MTTAIDRKLTVVRDRIRGVAARLNNGFYLYGRAGTSKTYTVRKTLDDLGTPYEYTSGHLTPMGLYDCLEKNYDRLLVLDDVAQIFTSKIAMQLFLSALGNSFDDGYRVIKYHRQGLSKTIHYTGAIIAISNLELIDDHIANALKSRIHYLKYDPSEDEIAEQMREIADQGTAALTPVECRQVTEFLINEAKRFNCRLDIRLLVDKCFSDFVQYRDGGTESHWHDMVISSVVQSLEQLRHPTRPAPRADRKAQEHELIYRLMGLPETKDRVAQWMQETGKSERAYYRRLNEIAA